MRSPLRSRVPIMPISYFPYAPCKEYVPTFTPTKTQMLVNIPYMEHMGLVDGFHRFIVSFCGSISGHRVHIINDQRISQTHQDIISIVSSILQSKIPSGNLT